MLRRPIQLTTWITTRTSSGARPEPCARCNREKGKRHDHKRGERLDDVIGMLQVRRTARWREPAAVGMAVRLAPVLQIEADAEVPDDD